jgi:NAD(P)H-hydrate repair Nnr-like enzyme with NAD(P)H-hydrate epimerase domain
MDSWRQDISVSPQLCGIRQREQDLIRPSRYAFARSLGSLFAAHFGYEPTIYLPKPGKNLFYAALLKQCTNLEIPVLDTVDEFKRALGKTDCVLDAIFGMWLDAARDPLIDIFWLSSPSDPIVPLYRLQSLSVRSWIGFSFSPPLRAPFTEILPLLAESNTPPIFSVDIPSGWDVSSGPPIDDGTAVLAPHALISLTTPKEGVRFFKGEKHWLGGRFVSSRVDRKFDLKLEHVWKVAGVGEQVVEIKVLGDGDEKAKWGAAAGSRGRWSVTIESWWVRASGI